MSVRTFVDTNVLVCAYDGSAQQKQRIAKSLLAELWRERAGVLSVQVLQEFYVTVTKKISRPLTKRAAREVAITYAEWCVETSASLVPAASQMEEDFQITFWDGLIVASAAKAGADRIVSEDMNDGQVISGVRIENPFR